MKAIIITTLISLVILLNNNQNSKKPFQNGLNNDKFFEIKYEDILKRGKGTILSQIASKVEYIQLETNTDCLLGPFAKYYFADSLIFISNRDHILKFSYSGKFLKRIGNSGRGPGEINSIWTMSVIPDKRMIVVHDAAMRKMTYLSFDGELIKTVTVPDLYYVKVMNDGRYIGYDQGLSKSEQYTFCLTNESGDIISGVKNYIPWKNPSGVAIVTSVISFAPFYTYRDRYHFKALYNDTIYVIDDDKIIPSYFINLGKYKLPDEKRAERLAPEQVQSFRTYGSNYYWANVFESGEIIFLTTNTFGAGSTNYFAINKRDYNINSSKSFDGITKGPIFNDLDGGIFFWPVGNVSDYQVFMPVDVSRLKKFIESEKSVKIPIKYPEKQKELKESVSNMDISNNPIIMIVTLK
jgi:hypothetical protein